MLKDLGQDKNQQEMGSKINKNSDKMSSTSHSKIIQVPNSAMYRSKQWKKTCIQLLFYFLMVKPLLWRLLGKGCQTYQICLSNWHQNNHILHSSEFQLGVDPSLLWSCIPSFKKIASGTLFVGSSLTTSTNPTTKYIKPTKRTWKRFSTWILILPNIQNRITQKILKIQRLQVAFHALTKYHLRYSLVSTIYFLRICKPSLSRQSAKSKNSSRSIPIT